MPRVPRKRAAWVVVMRRGAPIPALPQDLPPRSPAPDGAGPSTPGPPHCRYPGRSYAPGAQQTSCCSGTGSHPPAGHWRTIIISLSVQSSLIYAKPCSGESSFKCKCLHAISIEKWEFRCRIDKLNSLGIGTFKHFTVGYN